MTLGNVEARGIKIGTLARGLGIDLDSLERYFVRVIVIRESIDKRLA